MVPLPLGELLGVDPIDSVPVGDTVIEGVVLRESVDEGDEVGVGVPLPVPLDVGELDTVEVVEGVGVTTAPSKDEVLGVAPNESVGVPVDDGVAAPLPVVVVEGVPV